MDLGDLGMSKDTDVKREDIIRTKNTIVHKMLSLMEKRDLFPEDYSFMRNVIRQGLLLYCNYVLAKLNMRKVKLYREK